MTNKNLRTDETHFLELDGVLRVFAALETCLVQFPDLDTGVFSFTLGCRVQRDSSFDCWSVHELRLSVMKIHKRKEISRTLGWVS